MHNWVVERDLLYFQTSLSCTECGAQLNWVDGAPRDIVDTVVAAWLEDYELNSPCKET